MADEMAALIADAKSKGDSWGGVITVRVEGLPVGWGEPVFGKTKALLASALHGIGAVTGVVQGPDDLEARLRQPGTAFHAPGSHGPSEVYGGIQGGLTNGEPLQLRVLFKPPATLTDHAKAGRHDPCILPRAVPVVEAMVSLVLADLALLTAARAHRP
jgi:chorismate synthase